MAAFVVSLFLLLFAAIGWGVAARNGDACDRKDRRIATLEAENARLKATDLRRAELLGDGMRKLNRLIEAAERAREDTAL